MSTSGWRKNTSVARKLLEAPNAFSFLQAVRLLERSAVFEKALQQSNVASNPVARFTPPPSEAIRFRGNNTLSFSSAEVAKTERAEKQHNLTQWQVWTNIFGLTGAMGVMPYHYSELINNRVKQKDETMLRFFDLFNHRSISLFYAASTKYKLASQVERNKLRHEKEPDKNTKALLSIMGLGTKGLENRLHTKDESLVNFAGLFSQKIRTTSGLTQLIRAHFDIPVKIEEFIGQWQELIDDVRTKLPDLENPKGRNACLGQSAMLGKRGWFAQGKIRIILGPLNQPQFDRFAPDKPALKAMHELVRLYVGLENDYEFIIRINKLDLPEKIGLGGGQPAIMGWNTYLAAKPKNFADRYKTVDISVSSQRLR